MGWLALLVALPALGTPRPVAWLTATLGVVAVGVPLAYRARAATVVATVLVLMASAGFGALHHLAEADARRHVADHPPAPTPATTTQTFVVLPASGCENYPYSELAACDPFR